MHLGFKCHQCGRCCDSAPTLLVQEVYDFSKDFLIQGYISIQNITGIIVDLDKNPMNHRIYGDDQHRFMVANALTGLYAKSKCPKVLSNGKCSLHLEGRFPMSCATVPLHPFVGSNKIYKDQLKSYAKNYHCVVSGIKGASAPGMGHFLQSDRYNENSPLVMAMRKEEKAFSEPCQINFTDTIHEKMQEDNNLLHAIFVQLLQEIMHYNSPSIYANILPFYLLNTLEATESDLQKLFPNCWLNDKEKIRQFAKNQWELLHKPETIAMIENGTDFSVKQWEDYLKYALKFF